jgi:hypothetical protein
VRHARGRTIVSSLACEARDVSAILTYETMLLSSNSRTIGSQPINPSAILGESTKKYMKIPKSKCLICKKSTLGWYCEEHYLKKEARYALYDLEHNKGNKLLQQMALDRLINLAKFYCGLE